MARVLNRIEIRNGSMMEIMGEQIPIRGEKIDEKLLKNIIILIQCQLSI